MLSWAKISGKALRLWAEAARKYPRLRDESAVVSATLPPASFTDPPERRLGALAPAAHVQARGPLAVAALVRKTRRGGLSAFSRRGPQTGHAHQGVQTPI